MTLCVALAMAAAVKTDLPNVLIIGDSISMGYTPYVKEILKDEANVVRNAGNAGNTANGLAKLESWIGDTKWTVIHFNFGLHDLAWRTPGRTNLNRATGRLTHTPAVYANQLEVITTRLKKTNAKLIYGLTTPVPAGEPGRFMGDEHIYNYRARRIMGNAGVPINDLHSLVAPQMNRLQTRPGNVHFKPEGSRILGEQVAERIRAALR